MPAPPPASVWISTVTCRSRSAIQARCGGEASGALRTLTDDDLQIPRLAATQDAQRDGPSDAIGPEHGHEIFRLRDRMPGDRDDDVADEQSRRRRLAVGLDVNGDDRPSLCEVQSVAQR